MRSLVRCAVSTAALLLLAVTTTTHALPPADWERVGTMPWTGGASAFAALPQGRDEFAVAPNFGGDPAAQAGLLAFGGHSAGADGSRRPGRVWNDVYTSVDGVNWKSAGNAPWAARSKHHGLTVGSVVYMFGGWDPTGAADGADPTTPTYFGDTWMVSDGATWQRRASTAGWAPRLDAAATQTAVPATASDPAGAAALLVGGVGADGAYWADVWRSAEFGASWTLLVSHATGLTLFGARAGAAAVTVNGVPYLLGGHTPTGTALNDVWRSTDFGTTWECVAVHNPARTAGFPPRAYFHAAAVDQLTRRVGAVVSPAVHAGAMPTWDSAALQSIVVTAGQADVPSPPATTAPTFLGDAWVASRAVDTMAPVSPDAGNGNGVLGVTWSPLLAATTAPATVVVTPRVGHRTLVVCGYVYAYGGYAGAASPGDPTSSWFVSGIHRRFVGNATAHPPCAAGTFGCDASVPGTQPGGCRPCEAGTYSARPGMAACAPCPVGTYASWTGATRCADCPAGTWSYVAGARACGECSGSCPSGNAPNGGGGGGGGGSGRGGLSGGAVVGLVLGCIGVALGFAVACLVWQARRHRQRSAAAAAAAGGTVHPHPHGAAAPAAAAVPMGLVVSAPYSVVGPVAYTPGQPPQHQHVLVVATPLPPPQPSQYPAKAFEGGGAVMAVASAPGVVPGGGAQGGAPMVVVVAPQNQPPPPLPPPASSSAYGYAAPGTTGYAPLH